MMLAVSNPAPIQDPALARLVAGLDPELHPGTYAFVQRPSDESNDGIDAVATVDEREGRTFVVPTDTATSRDWPVGFEAAWITLRVFSELDAVGLTAVVATELAQHGIPCNVVAGFSHDHLFVPAADGSRAAELLLGLSRRTAETLRGAEDGEG